MRYNREPPHEAGGHLPPEMETPPQANETVWLKDVIYSSRLGGRRERTRNLAVATPKALGQIVRAKGVFGRVLGLVQLLISFAASTPRDSRDEWERIEFPEFYPPRVTEAAF